MSKFLMMLNEIAEARPVALQRGPAHFKVGKLEVTLIRAQNSSTSCVVAASQFGVLTSDIAPL